MLYHELGSPFRHGVKKRIGNHENCIRTCLSQPNQAGFKILLVLYGDEFDR